MLAFGEAFGALPAELGLVRRDAGGECEAARKRGGDQGEPERLASCYRRSLGLAAQNGIRSIAFPAISCGVYGYPIEAAVAIAVREARQWLDRGAAPLRIVFCTFGDALTAAYRRELASAFPLSPST